MPTNSNSTCRRCGGRLGRSPRAGYHQQCYADAMRAMRGSNAGTTVQGAKVTCSPPAFRYRARMPARARGERGSHE